jgi:Ca2+-binding EF-hand superfamily protein
MSKFLFAGAALAALAAIPAAAQPGEGRMRPAGPLTRAAAEARVEARFERADANHDGFVTEEEVRLRGEMRRANRQHRRGERRAQLFERLDADHDGSISREEFEARPALRGGEGERRGRRLVHRRGRGGGMMAGFGARAFERLDADRDGRVALAEAERAALERFDRVDSDRDGTISAEERQAAREAFRGRMRERQED